MKPISGTWFYRYNLFMKNYLPLRFKSSDDVVDMAYLKFDKVKPKSGEYKSPLIALHALFGSKSNWQSVCNALNKKTERTVFAVDVRNHGDSPHTVDFSYDLIIGDLKNFIESFSYNEVCLLGHSMGGRAAMYFSIKLPQYVEKLIVVDISPLHTSTDLERMYSFLEIMRIIKVDPSLSLGEGRKEAKKQMSQYLNSTLLIDYLTSNLVKRKSGNFEWKLNIDTLERKFFNLIKFPSVDGSFHKPTLFVSGLKSDYFSKGHEVKINQMFTKAKFIYLNTGHWVQAEDPKGIIQAITDFLEE